MRRVKSEASIAGRARWLAELAEALNEAQKVAWRLGQTHRNPEAMALYGRIDAALAEVESLRRRSAGPAANKKDPEWIGSHPWSHCGAENGPDIGATRSD